MPLDEAVEARSMKAFRDLGTWIDHYGWAGYDPYDIRGQDWYLIFGGQSFPQRKIRGVLSRVENALGPIFLRRLLRIEKQVNAKGVGLIASAYISAFRATREAFYLDKAAQALDWLSSNYSRQYPGISWGYPFYWHSRVLIPKGVPSVVVTGTVGLAFLDHYELTGEPHSFRILEGIARFFLEGLNRTVEEDGLLCFSYTPLDHFRVLNANMFAAAFLARLAALTGEGQYADTALEATRYVITEQDVDGAFHYWGSEPDSVVDHYHTGFVLRHLDTVKRATGEEFIAEPLGRGYRFYLERLFTGDGIPMRTPERYYPVDIHSCAEALLCVSQLEQYHGGEERLSSVLDFTLTRMRHPDGWFIHRISKQRNRERRLEIPYMRWGQAWMLAALARLLERNKKCA